MAADAPTRVVFYEPYAAWPLHGHTSALLARDLRARGAEVHYVTCDGLFSDCSLYREAVNPRPADACLACQSDVIALAREHGLSLTWLGRYLRIEEARAARAWVASLAPAELGDARHGEWRLGEWLAYSIHCHLRDAYPEVEDPHAVAVRRSFLTSGLLACFALERLLGELRPDVLITFHGRLASTRLALELAGLHGVRCLTHYRAPRGEDLALVEGEATPAVELAAAYREAWGAVALSAEENAELDAHLAASQGGGDRSVVSFQAAGGADGDPGSRRAALAAELGISEHRPLWVLFNSSGEDDHIFDARTPLAGQHAWTVATIEYARAHPEIDLIIRAHPNIGSDRSPGVNRRQLAELEALKATLPANVLILDPSSPVNSYTLMDLATAGLVWGSTAGLEMALRGKAVVVVSRAFVHGAPYVRTVGRAEEYPVALDELRALSPGHVDPEIARAARRHAHGIFVRLHVPFPLLRATGFNEGERLLGRDGGPTPAQTAALDRIAAIVLGGERPWPAPTPAQRARSRDAEDAVLATRFGLRPAALADAPELIADPTLLGAWAQAFARRPPPVPRLFVETAEDEIPGLIAAVEATGLLASETVEIVAGHFAATFEAPGPGGERPTVIAPSARLTRGVASPAGGFAGLAAVADAVALERHFA